MVLIRYFVAKLTELLLVLQLSLLVRRVYFVAKLPERIFLANLFPVIAGVQLSRTRRFCPAWRVWPDSSL